MRVNRIEWDNLKAKWDLLKIASGFLHGERTLQGQYEEEDRAQAEKEKENGATPESFHFVQNNTNEHLPNLEGMTFDQEGNPRPLTAKEFMYEKGLEVTRQLDEALYNEEYIKAQTLTEVLKVITIKYNKL